MKRFTPYIFPLLVLAIVFFLVYRWYNMRSQPVDSANEGIEIENLSDTDAQSIMRGTGNFETAPLEKSEDSQSDVEGVGSIRYEVKEGKVRFSVSADLPQSESGYIVWVRKAGTEDLTQAFTLEMGKGGYVGTAALSESLLPLEVIVANTTDEAEAKTKSILKGVINKKLEVTGAESATPGAGTAE